MTWTLELSKEARQELQSLDRVDQKRIGACFDDLLKLENPHSKGHALTGFFRGYWRYRVGKYRIICDLQDDRLVIVALRIGHRNMVYRRPLSGRIRSRPSTSYRL